MTDSAIRQHERSTDPTEQVRWLAELHRVEPWRIEVAAYCGHEGAREVAPRFDDHTFSGVSCVFADWLRGLERWEGALLRAANATHKLRFGAGDTPWSQGLGWRFEVEGATRSHGEQPTREAICSALIAWALHG